MDDKKKEILVELLKRLNGKCSDCSYTCPKWVANALGYDYSWTNVDCYDNFLVLAEVPQEEQHRFTNVCTYSCPCHSVPFDVLESKILELIEE